MSNVYKVENFEHILECPICFERYKTPKVLPCQHTFCLACLRSTYNTHNRTITCPTCRTVVKLRQGLEELPNNITFINLMDVEPAKAKCPCCNQIEILTICEHCSSTKCKSCNQEHIVDMQNSTRVKLQELEQVDHNELEASIKDSFQHIKSEINNQFQRIRQQQDSILLTKQWNILQQLDSHEKSLLTQVENDLQPLLQLRNEITGKKYDLESKSEPELIDLSTKVSSIQSLLIDKIGEYETSLNSIEVSLQYDKDHIDHINELCNKMKLSIISTDDDKHNAQTTNSILSEPIQLTLRTFLNQEYKLFIASERTIYELKQIIGQQENIDPGSIMLTFPNRLFDLLDDKRTLKSYNCDSKTILLISIKNKQS